MNTKYKPFLDENEIVAKIKRDKEKISDLFKEKLTYQEIINTAIGSNTYRIFKSNGTKKPSSVFKNWAFSILGNEDEIKPKLCVKTDEELDAYFNFLTNDLLKKWNMELTGMTIYRSRKIVSLLLKNFCFWEKFSEIELENYIFQIPLPLDSRTISAIRLSYNKIGKYKIPTNPTMGFIDSDEKYMDFQQYFKYLAKKSNVPVIYLDYLYYNFE